jgi:ABC-type transport system involved in multi-copper enzyme maturation permease subunit
MPLTSATDDLALTPTTGDRFDPRTGPTRRRTRGDDLSALPGALKSEWIKATSLRSNRAIVVVTFIGGAATSLLVATLVKDEVLYLTDVAFYWTVVSAMLAAVCGITAFTAEVQHGTLAPLLTARASRWSLWLTKLVTVAVFGAVLGIVGVAGGLAGGMLGDLPTGDADLIPATIIWAIVNTTLSALLGLGVGLIVRNGSAAISGLLIWGLVVENLLTVFLAASVVRFLPFYAGTQLLAIESDLDSPEAIANALSRTQSALVLATYASVAVVVGMVLLARRNIE